MIPDRCSNCRFWREYDYTNAKDGSGHQGQCHRRAPLVTGGMMSSVETVWPETHATDWCGDYEADEMRAQVERNYPDRRPYRRQPAPPYNPDLA